MVSTPIRYNSQEEDHVFSSSEQLLLQALYDNNRIPLWIFNKNLELKYCFFSVSHGLRELLAAHTGRLILKIASPDFDILSYENELYYIFKFERNFESFYLFGGPMLLSGFYHITEMRSLSFADNINTMELKSLVENLPVVSLNSFGSCLRIMMLLLKQDAPGLNEISNYKFSNLQGSLNRTFIHELFENMEDCRIHTPYSHEIAVLNCVKEGNTAQLEATYKTLPQVRYGNMSNNPLRQLFYGCIANTTLITRYAIEGGLDEETAFTLSDVYIKKMENCRTLYELNILNEKMAVDFTRRVAEAKASKKPDYIKPISRCIDYIFININNKITLDTLAKEVKLTPKYLSYLFRKETGQTLSSFIEGERINKAKNLLIYSEYSYSHISHYLSFYSQSYFISIFKKRVGMTPKEYRERYSQANW
ncbi:MAG: AraC-type DNA-binding protein [Eubacterium sp.]|jgi:AraC-like DNA-binding protein|nr:AraC-type DNA-binding protein [Eubacterium sp.]